MTQLTPSFVQLSRSAVLWGQYKPQNSSCPFGFLLSNSSGRKLRLAGRDLSHVKRLVHKDFSLDAKSEINIWKVTTGLQDTGDWLPSIAQETSLVTLHSFLITLQTY